MLTAYFDESGISPDQSLCIVAGFVGNAAQWNAVMSEWIPALQSRPHLHMKKLRWNQQPERIARLLNRLGPIPYHYNLTPVYAGVRWKNYLKYMRGRVREMYTHPYMMCAARCMAWVLGKITKDDQVLFVFDRQDVHGLALESMKKMVFEFENLDPRVEAVQLASRPSAASGLAKNNCLDIADFLAFQLREYRMNRRSPKAKLGKSIMGRGKIAYGNIFTAAEVKEMANAFVKAGMVPGGGPAKIPDDLMKQLGQMRAFNYRMKRGQRA